MSRLHQIELEHEIMETISQTHLMAALCGYLVGSIPFGLVLANITGAGNLREIGSGNIGATNVLRTGRKGIAVATLILDIGKGAVAVFGALCFSLDLAIIAGLFAVFGHNFPVWLKFKGGKGVATTLGAVLAIAWQVGLLTVATWLVTAAVFRYSSLAAILSLSLSPFYAYFLADQRITFMVTILAAISILRHLKNIQRLFKGEEGKIKLFR